MINKIQSKTNVLLLTSIMAFLVLPMVFSIVYAQYMGNVGQTGQTGARTLEETLQLARDRVNYAESNPASGSGTPYISASGVVGASVIAGTVFGGIAIAFFLKARHGRYYAMGRG